MLLFLVVPFFLAGTVLFVLCCAIAPLRRFALSAALWCLALIPGAFFWVTAAAALMTGREALGRRMHFPSWQYSAWHALNSRPATWVSIGFGVLITFAIATAVAAVHQALIQRMTFRLFRIYAAGVAMGVGSLLGIFLAVGLTAAGIHPMNVVWLWVVASAVLCAAAGYAAYRWARAMRDPAPPERFAWVTPEEFDGTA